jgi:hypothetical protein
MNMHSAPISSRIRSLSVVLITTLGGVLLVSPAVARPLSQSLTGAAKESYEAGKVHFADGNFRGAMLKFEAAYDASKDVRLLWNAAAAARGDKRYAKALEFLNTYLKEGDGVLSAADRTDAEDSIKGLEPLVSRLRLAIAQPEAQVTVDEQLVGTSPLPRAVLLDVGPHHVVVRKPGFAAFDQTITLRDRETTLEVPLVAEAVSGRIEITVQPAGAAISVDGKPAGRDGMSMPLPAGSHALKISLADYNEHRVEFTLKGGESRNFNITLEKQKKGVPAWVWITGGVLLAGGAATAVYFATRPPLDRPLPPGGTFSTGYAFASF